MGWVFLAGSILAEVSATLSLRASVDGRRAWLAVVTVGYLIAFTLLSLTLQQGIGIGVAYGIWTALGVALTAIGSRVLFDEPLTGLMWGGIGLIAAGVLLVELGAQ